MAHHEALIAAGIGCRAISSVEDIAAAVNVCARSHDQPPALVRALCSASFKAASEALEGAAHQLGIRLILFSHDVLARHSHAAITFSAAAYQRFELPSIAETAALAGALELSGGNRHVRLLGARVVVGTVTCALASAAEAP